MARGIRVADLNVKQAKLPAMATHVGVKGRNVTEKKCSLYTRQEAVEAPEEEMARLNKHTWS